MPLPPFGRAALLGAVCALAVIAPPARALPGEKSDSVLARVRRGVVGVVTYDERGAPLLRGSGFFAARGLVVTSLHVLRGASTARIVTHEGKPHEVSGVVAASAGRDLVLLRVTSPDDTYVTLEIESEPPRAGEEVAVYGDVTAADWRVRRGAARGVWFMEGTGDLIQITARIEGGNSGGPVVNGEGRVVGVASLFARSSAELNFAVTSDAIRELMPRPSESRLDKLGRALTADPVVKPGDRTQ